MSGSSKVPHEQAATLELLTQNRINVEVSSMQNEDVREQTPQSVRGEGAVDTSREKTVGGTEVAAVSGEDTENIGLENEATTGDGGIAIDGGKLPGNKDDFEHELDEGPHAVPGANKQHHPAHAMNKGETKHTGM
jgi:hypothetical protein